MNLRFEVVRVSSGRERLAAALGLVRQEPGPAIVYVGTRNLAESLARWLWNWGVRAIPYHAGLTRERRTATLEQFLRGETRVVVATCAFGMGIDKPDVRLVLHWIMPATPESYYQEAGRAGRDGHPSRCLLLFAPVDARSHRGLLNVTFPAEGAVERAWGDPAELARLPTAVRASVERLRAELRPERGPVAWHRVRRRRRLALARLEAMERYAAGQGCRRRALLGWFGESIEACAGCDRCPDGHPIDQGRNRYWPRNVRAPGVSSR